MAKSRRIIAPVLGLALAAVVAACSSGSPTASPSASPTSAASSAQPAASASPSTQSTATEPGAPPAQATGGFGAKAAVEVPGPQVYYFFPAPGTLTEPDCMHGEIRDSQGNPTSRWTTTLCAYSDPTNPGYTRYYDWNNGANRDTQWVATMARAADGWIYEQNRWSQAGPNDVWFRYKPSNTSYTEISVTPWGTSPLNSFESVDTYNQSNPTAGPQEENRMTVAIAAMLVMQLQVFHVSGPAPYTQAQVTNAEQGGGVPPALQNITNDTLDNLLATDPVGRISSS